MKDHRPPPKPDKKARREPESTAAPTPDTPLDIEPDPALGNARAVGMVQRMDRGSQAEPEPGELLDGATRNGGGPVPHRQEMEGSFHEDFSDVRAFTGRTAEMDALGAEAATRGSDVFFASPSPGPDVVAHELTHVVQQQHGKTGTGIEAPGSGAEREAEGAAGAVARGDSVSVSASPEAPIALRATGEQAPADSQSAQNEDPLTGSASVTGEGARTEGAAEYTGGKHVQYTVGAGMEATFDVVVAPVKDNPAACQVTATLSVGGNAALSTEKEAGQKKNGQSGRENTQGTSQGTSRGNRSNLQMSGGAEVHGAGSAQAIYVHVMEVSQVQQYLQCAQAASAGVALPGFTGFAELERLYTLAVNLADGSLTDSSAVLGDAGAARQMKEGDSAELVLSGSYGGSANVGAEDRKGRGSLSVEGSIEEGFTRSVKVERIPDGNTNWVRITVAFTDSEALSGKVGGSGGAVSAHHAREHSEGSGQSVTFALDADHADYTTWYDRILECPTREGLQALRESLEGLEDGPARVAAWGENQERKDAQETGVGSSKVPVTFIGNEHSEYADEVKVDLDENEVTGSARGGAGYGATVDVNGHTPLKYDENNVIEMNVDEEGNLTGDLHEEVNESDPERSLDAATDLVTDPSKLLDPEALGQELLGLLDATYQTLRGYEMDETAVNAIIQRAANEGAWHRCCRAIDGDIMKAWLSLRTQLVNPAADPRYADVDPVGAAQLARAQALAGFMEMSGESGLVAIRNVMRYWAEYSGNSSADDVGRAYEWPPDLHDQKEEYETLKEEVEALPDRFRSLVHAADGYEQVEEITHDLEGRLVQVSLAIRNCEDISDERTRMEMIDGVYWYLHQVRAAEVDFHDAQLLGEWGLTGKNREMAEMTAGRGYHQARRDGWDPDKEKANKRISVLQGYLRELKSKERQLFGEARASFQGDFLLVFDVEYDTSYEAAEKMGDVEELHEFWIDRILEMRAAYRTAGLPESEWEVSTGPGEPRNARTEPDVETLCAIYDEADVTGVDPGPRMRDWRRRVESY